jgi:DNA-binding transcriptional LysR family regulator
VKFDQLQYFVEAARRQHIGQAAVFLNISPSAISHSIAALEEELGRSLFEKQGRQIKLTHHGKLLLERAEYLLGEANRIREELSSGEQELRGHVRLAATHVICSDFVTPAWISIQDLNPQLTSTIHSLKSGEVLARVNSGETDIGFCLSPHSSPSHEQELLHEGKLVMCFSKKHPFLKERRLDDLAKYPSLAAQGTQGIESCENHPAFARLGFEPKVANLFDNYSVAVQALKNNQLWVLLPDFLAVHFPDIETYVPRGWDATYRLSAVWPKYRIRTQALNLLIQKVGDAVRMTMAK